ncbi:MAG: helix-turn-helix domain-containing protein [Comamonas sp.]
MTSSTATQASDAEDAAFGAAVRARRAQLGITLDQLAQASGVSPGALSRVERGLLATSLRNAMAIARGLGCELGELVQGGAAAQVTRAGEHLRFVDEASGVERLALASPSAGLNLVQYRFPPRAVSSHFAAHRAGTREVFHVLEGSIEVFTAHEQVLLHAGDTATLVVDSEHRLANAGDVPARLLLLVLLG